MRFPRMVSPRAMFLSFAAMMMLAPLANADHLMITRYFSGAWAQPDHESQGIVLHIAEQEGGEKVGVAHWFTFGDDLDSAWFVGTGPVVGHTIEMRLFAASGIGFLEPVDEASPLVEEIGTLLLSFQNCNQGTAEYETPEEYLGTGSVRIKRLTSLFRARCSGGISDDTPSDKRPEKLGVQLHSVRDEVTGGGKAMFWQRADRSDFKVAVQEAPDGIYDLMVCGEDEGDLEVVAGEGELEYRSPGIDDKLLLDFVPTGCMIELHDDLGAAFSSGDAVLAAMDHGRDDRGRVEIEVDLTNTGVYPVAEGEAEFEIRGNKLAFSVEIEHLPIGMYPLLVAGMEEAQIEVTESDGMTKGKVIFTAPHEMDSEMLDFDPRGEVIEVLEGDVVILESLFPDE